MTVETESAGGKLAIAGRISFEQPSLRHRSKSRGRSLSRSRDQHTSKGWSEARQGNECGHQGSRARGRSPPARADGWQPSREPERPALKLSPKELASAAAVAGLRAGRPRRRVTTAIEVTLARGEKFVIDLHKIHEEIKDRNVIQQQMDISAFGAQAIFTLGLLMGVTATDTFEPIGDVNAMLSEVFKSIRSMMENTEGLKGAFARDQWLVQDA